MASVRSLAARSIALVAVAVAGCASEPSATTPPPPVCGNAVIEAGEQCDDGNVVGGDGCSSRCTTEACGNGILDKGEQCDDANTTSGDGCSSLCAYESCGDGIVNHGESCDDGGESAACNADCTIRVCGDSKINRAAGEQCDDGGSNADDRDCTSSCRINVCTDGHRNTFGPMHVEACDDGNTIDTDGCSNACLLPSCGNGIVEPSEQCDDGNAVQTDGCVNCSYAVCGDGFTHSGVEQCDDGGLVSGDGCSATCTLEVCGNGVLDVGEECDDANTTSGDGCSGATSPLGGCRFERCGDGVVNDAEPCDRALSPDICNFDCTLSSCGDGKVNPTAVPSEQCDDANLVAGDGCFACRFEKCGNGVVDLGEECDGLAGAGAYGCSVECFQIRCGNGRLDPGEECDDGNAIGTDTCVSSNPDPSTCVLARCGDGIVDQTAPGIEACDDGFANSNSGACLPNCQFNVCGDGLLRTSGPAPEACDDGNTIDETSCPYGQSCVSCNAICSQIIALNGGICGDGTVDAPYERCDDDNTVACGSCSADCQSLQLAYAVGQIVAVPASGLVDGQVFVINDGVGMVVVFEFDTDFMATGVPIELSATDDASHVATKIVNAISSQTGLRVAAVATGPLVSLTHEVRTSFGNQSIASTVTSPDFYVDGMAGGAGGDCGAGIGCAYAEDCASEICGGVAPHTCN